MDNWILKGPNVLVNEQTPADTIFPTQVKVKVSYLLLTTFDGLLFNGTVEAKYPKTIGRAAVGIVTEVGNRCYGIEKGMRVYFNPTRPCNVCLACKNGKPKDCNDVHIAGKNFDGFLRDFVVCDYNDVAPLPDAVDVNHALCIEPIGIAEHIYDKLNLLAGSRVAVLGGDFYGNIVAQVLKYHKLIPIVIDNNAQNLERAQKCGMFYTFAADDDLMNNIMSATSGSLCDAAVYCSSSRLPMALAANTVACNKTIVLTSPCTYNSNFDAREVMERRLTLHGVSEAYDYTDAVINMLVHDAVNIDYFEKQTLTEYDPVALLKALCDNQNAAALGSKMTILKMIM